MLSTRIQQGAFAAASAKILVTARSASPSYLHGTQKGGGISRGYNAHYGGKDKLPAQKDTVGEFNGIAA